MPATTERPDEGVPLVKSRRWVRAAWFVGLYAASLAVFTAFVQLLRWLMKG